MRTIPPPSSTTFVSRVPAKIEPKDDETTTTRRHPVVRLKNPETNIVTKKPPQPQDDEEDPSTAKNKELPLQLRQLKENWDTSKVPKGNVMDRIKIFGGGDPGQKKDFLEDELTNTGKINPALKKRREMERQREEKRLQELEEKKKRTKSTGFGKSMYGKKKAATCIQAIVRMYLAKKIAHRKVDQAIAQAKRDALMNISKEEKHRQDEAATKIQSCVRSALTRARVCRLVEQMISDLMAMDKANSAKAQDAELEAAALKAAEEARMKSEDDREALASASREGRERTAEELARDVAEKQQAADEKQRMIEEEAALGRAARELAADELASEKAAAAEREEAERLAKEEAHKARKEAAALEREKRLKSMNLFVGPLPWGVGLLPDWWMASAPYKVLQLDVITEDDNGEDFEDWRTENLNSAEEAASE